jgi:hypothetical protein
MKTIEENVIEWAKERDLIKPENAPKQIFKLVEEVGEIFGAYLKNDIDGIKDGIGDAQVVLIILLEQLGQKRVEHCLGGWCGVIEIKHELLRLSACVGLICRSFEARNEKEISTFEIEYCFNYLESIAKRYDTTLNECLELAYNEIKNRKGKTVNGSFIREK